jgi:hypothetical protein
MMVSLPFLILLLFLLFLRSFEGEQGAQESKTGNLRSLLFSALPGWTNETLNA